jgi:flagellar motor switch protein FliM
MQSSSGIMTICYPYLTLETVISKLSAQNWIDKNKKMMDTNEYALNVRRIVPVKAEMKAIPGAPPSVFVI